MNNFQEIEIKTVGWAIAKGIAEESNKKTQLLKFYEEAGEVAGALLKDNPKDLKTEIGDVLVTLAIFAKQNRMTLTECFEAAYEKISKRTGSTINGSFVKD